MLSSCTEKQEPTPPPVKVIESELNGCANLKVLVEMREVEKKLDVKIAEEVFHWNTTLGNYVYTINEDKKADFSDGDSCYMRICVDNPGLVYITLSKHEQPADDSLTLSFDKHYDVNGTIFCYSHYQQ